MFPTHAPQTGHRLTSTWLPATALTLGQHTPLLSWLQHQGSLTARLRAHCGGQFTVEVLNQYWGCARADEALIQGISPRARVLIREVLLKGYGQPWVWARSILPASSLSGSLRCLRKLDNQPLGGWLFKQPSLERGPMTVAYLKPAELPVSELLGIEQPLWGRRSVFRVQGKPMLVGEVFLPDFLDTL
jgi:chorismate--pyruvate lyase